MGRFKNVRFLKIKLPSTKHLFDIFEKCYDPQRFKLKENNKPISLDEN